jgi:hypothetical protein
MLLLLLLPQQSWSGVCILSIIIMGRAGTTTEEQSEGCRGTKVFVLELLNRSKDYCTEQKQELQQELKHQEQKLLSRSRS